MKVITTNGGLWDKVSSITSILCIIHCVLLPIAFSTLPLLGIEIIENIFIETATVIVAIFIGGYAIVKGYRKYHHNKTIPVLFSTGLIAMISSNFIPVEIAAGVLKVAGAVAIVTAHIKNRKACKHCTTCNNPTNKI